jgi:tetratricopeptide (TPR) repeat protein
LALKLAAVWLRVMPVAQIVAEVERSLDILATHMRDVPPRQRSLRAIFDYTYARLAPAEQRALAALSIFRGGFRQEAAVQVAGAALPVLAALVEKSLVQAAPDGRYSLHELLRQFAAERLAEAPEAQSRARQQHSAYYLGFLKQHETALLGPDQRLALTAMGEAIENVQSAWRWAVTHNNLAALAPVVDTLSAYYQMRSRFHEGHELFGWTAVHWPLPSAWAEAAQARLALAQVLARWGVFGAGLHEFKAATEHLQAALALSPPPAEQAFILAQLGWVAIDQGQRAAAEAYLRECLALSRACGDLRGEAEALSGLGRAAYEFGDFVPATALIAQSLAVCRQLGRPDRVAATLGSLAWPTSCLGRYAEAEAHWLEAQAVCQQLGDRLGAAINQEFLGWVAWCVGGERLPEAIAHYEAVLVTFREFGNRHWMGMCLGDLALALTEQGEAERALRYAREGLALAREIGVLHLVNYTLAVVGAAACEQGDLATSRQYLAQALQASVDLQKQDTVMIVLLILARLLLKESAAAGETPLRAQKLARAREYLALVRQNPATWQAIRDRASRLLADLPPDDPDSGLPAVGASTATLDWSDLTQRLAPEFADPPAHTPL